MLILLGILGVVALGRFTGTDAFAARGFFDDTVSAVQFAQKLAISSGCDVRVIITANSYRLRQSSACDADNFTASVDNPVNRDIPYQNVNAPSGFSFNLGSITFNARGEREGATSDFTFSGGSLSYSFRVHSSTGLVEVL